MIFWFLSSFVQTTILSNIRLSVVSRYTPVHGQPLHACPRSAIVAVPLECSPCCSSQTFQLSSLSEVMLFVQAPASVRLCLETMLVTHLATLTTANEASFAPVNPQDCQSAIRICDSPHGQTHCPSTSTAHSHPNCREGVRNSNATHDPDEQPTAKTAVSLAKSSFDSFHVSGLSQLSSVT